MRTRGKVKGASSGTGSGTKGSWRLKLYVAGFTGTSRHAFENLQKLCAQQWGGKCRFEVVDLLRNPARAKKDEIVFIPTLVRTGRGPARRVVGDLSDTERALRGLGLLD